MNAMTTEQKQSRRESAKRRAARLKEAFRRKNPGKVPLPMVTIRKKRKAAA